MSARTTLSALALATATAAGAAVAATPATHAAAAAPAPSRLTIVVEGTDMSGTLSSPRPGCEGNRMVILYKVIGRVGGGDDSRYAQDTTEVQAGVGLWSTGNTGVAGRFYAKVRATPRCGGDTTGLVTIPRK